MRVELAAKVKLRGSVVDLEGAPVVGAAVRVGQGRGFTVDERETPRTDAEGRFEVEGAPVGPVTILVAAPRGAAVEYSQAVISTNIAGGPEVELAPIRVTKKRLKSGEAGGDLGYAIGSARRRSTRRSASSRSRWCGPARRRPAPGCRPAT